MEPNKQDIITTLQTDIMRLQGFKQERGNNPLDAGSVAVASSFFLNKNTTSGFVAGLLNALMGSSGPALMD